MSCAGAADLGARLCMACFDVAVRWIPPLHDVFCPFRAWWDALDALRLGPSAMLAQMGKKHGELLGGVGAQRVQLRIGRGDRKKLADDKNGLAKPFRFALVPPLVPNRLQAGVTLPIEEVR